MLKFRLKQALALFLCGLLIRPAPLTAEPAAILGSVTPQGQVNVGDVRLPGMSALFAGDQIRTDAGRALIQYKQGPRVVLEVDSQASFSPSRVELQKGQMSFTSQEGGPMFAASTLRIEPIEINSKADVTYRDHKATVRVTEGSFRVVDPSGDLLASLRTGEARLFEEVSPAAPAPGAPAAVPPAAPAAPQAGSGGSKRTWLLVLGMGVVGTTLGIAALVSSSDEDEVANAELAAARAEANDLQAQVNTFKSSANLTSQQRAQLESIASTISSIQTSLAQGNLTEAQRQSLLNQLASAQSSLRQFANNVSGQVSP